jgi:hypothetical protein
MRTTAVISMSVLVAMCPLLIFSESAHADEPPPYIKASLERPILGPDATLNETQVVCATKISLVPLVGSVEEWEALAKTIRADMLATVVYRGRAAQWRDAKLGVEFLDTIEGGTGYKIQKLRYEALPGLWIPAVLYLPEKLDGRVPVAMNVNGHDPNGKAADYKQMRCINQAKRGMIVLNPEWFGMGQFANPDFGHYRMNQLDLCGTSGLAPFYLSMKRGLDVLLAHPNADPTRVAVSGLSGGGWQTIFISSLDTRVTLSNPVAGYSSLLSRIGEKSDLGDSEQQPCDMAMVGDYTHLTALLAPRPSLLTYNAKDNCCFVAAGALPRLLNAAEPIFKLYGKEANLRTHVNEIPGDHNFGQENREAHYRILGDHFFAGKPFDAHEIPSGNEVKSQEQLFVPLPENNTNFHRLALDDMQKLPLSSVLPAERSAIGPWQEMGREELKKILRYKPLLAEAETVSKETQEGTDVLYWKLRLDDKWTVPVVEFSQGTTEATTILLADAGRKSLAAEVDALVKQRHRVLAVDPFYFGEASLGNRDFLYGIMVSTVGDRPLGLQAAQIVSIAEWQRKVRGTHPITIQAHGPRTSLISLCAAAINPTGIADARLYDSFGSLKQIIEQNRGVNEAPELFCFGLLERFDIRQLTALCVPRKINFEKPSERVQAELKDLPALYTLLNVTFSPIGEK